ncbi:hypothetical protein EON67_07495 [archaeon]|nr:MAG: hypothetical protein EON67_07495 [archaeon]
MQKCPCCSAAQGSMMAENLLSDARPEVAVRAHTHPCVCVCVRARAHWRTAPTGLRYMPCAYEALRVLLRAVVQAQWHPELNGPLSPSQVGTWTTASAWWKCSASPEHVWIVRTLSMFMRARLLARHCSSRRTLCDGRAGGHQ